jgi:DNA-binding NarL/FixJ family response regulator
MSTLTAASPARPVRVFIVEDHAVILDALVATLHELAGVELVGCATSESAGVAWLATHPLGADVLIIDIFLASGSGLGVLRAARQQMLAARRVVLTNSPTAALRRHCAALGAERVYDKTEEIDALIDFLCTLSAHPMPAAAIENVAHEHRSD